MGANSALIFCLVIYGTQAVHLPFVEPCAKDDPKLNECILQKGNVVLRGVLPGYPELDVPSLSPMVIERVDMSIRKSLKIKLTNLQISGIETCKLIDFHWNLKNQHANLTLYCLHTKIKSNYEMTGSILLMDLNSKGNAEMDFEDSTYFARFDYLLSPKTGGKSYLTLGNETLTELIKKASFHFDNLPLGGMVNKFMTDNWPLVSGEVSPTIVATMKQIFIKLFSNIVKKVSFEELFTA